MFTNGRIAALSVMLAAWAAPLTGASSYITYAAWADQAALNKGRMYIYTGGYPSTDLSLYNASTALTSITNLWCGFPLTGVGPYQPAAQVSDPACSNSGAGFGNDYFKLVASNPVVWEVEEWISGDYADSHDFLAAADTQTYQGTVFMTFMRGVAGVTGTAGTYVEGGDQAAVINTGPGPITVAVAPWAGAVPGGAWNTAATVTSPSIPPGGIWMWSPNQNAAATSGGTSTDAQGHYQFKSSGGAFMLYKGNTYPDASSGGARDNLMLEGPDWITAAKVGTDLVGAVVDGAANNIVVSNQTAGAVTFSLMKFTPNTPGANWPLCGLDPSGSWTTILTGQSVAPNGSWVYNAQSSGGGAGQGFYRVVSSGGYLGALFGANVLDQKWCDGDYLYANDTRRAFGMSFAFGTWIDGGLSGDPQEIHVVAPFAGTTVNLVGDGTVSGANCVLASATTTGPDQGIRFPVLDPGNNNQVISYRLTSNHCVYTYVMSTTLGGANDAETFFSVPPAINPLVIAQKSVDKPLVSPGDTVTYTLVADSLGQGTVTGVALWDTLAAGTSLVWSSQAPNASSSAPYYSWSLPDLSTNDAFTVTLAVRVDSGASGEVKHNTASASSASTEAFQSSDAPVSILVPGAGLSKSVNAAVASVGDTLTYVLTYTNTSTAYPATPKLDLETLWQGGDASTQRYNFKVHNWDTVPVNISDLSIAYWSRSAIGGVNVYYGGQTSAPYCSTGLNGTSSAVAAGFQVADRQANYKAQFFGTGACPLTPGDNWSALQTAISGSFSGADYSRTPTATATDDPHFVLFWKGIPVLEYLSAGAVDPNTGMPPYPAQMQDAVPAGLSYLGGAPPPLSVSAGVLDWQWEATRPQQSVSFTWWGQVLPSANGSTVSNVGSFSDPSGVGISNRVGTFIGAYISPTPSPSGSPTASPSGTPTLTLTWTGTATPTATLTATLTATPTASASPSATATGTATLTVTPSPTLSATASPSATPTVSPTPSGSPTLTATPTDSATPTSTCTATQSVTWTGTPTPSSTATESVTWTGSPTATPTLTVTPTATQSVTWTGSPTATPTLTVTPTATQSITWTGTPTFSGTPTATPTATESPTGTPTPTATPTPTQSATPSPSGTATATPTPSPSASQTPTATATVTPSPTRTATGTATPTPSVTCTATVSPTPSPSPSLTQTPFPAPFKLSVTLFNAAGERVRSLYSGPAGGLPTGVSLSAHATLSGGGVALLFPCQLQAQGVWGSTLWWGTDNDGGQLVGPGVYTIQVLALDPFGLPQSLMLTVQVLPSPTEEALQVFNSAGEVVAHLKAPEPYGMPWEDLWLDQAAVAISDASGGAVLLRGRDQGGNLVALAWNGTDDEGKPLASGSYIIQLGPVPGSSSLQTLCVHLQLLRFAAATGLGSAFVAPDPATGGAVHVLGLPPGLWVQATLFTLAGERVVQAHGSGGTLDLLLTERASGIYVLALEAPRSQPGLKRRLLKVAVVR